MSRSPKTPEPHQDAAIDFLSSRFHAACGDEPGLGKTDSALWAAARCEIKTGLVTCPASVRTHWRAHIREHFKENAVGWNVISYNGACSPDVRKELLFRYDAWIGDEIHFCKSLDSQRSHAVLGKDGLARRARFKWPLSGTITPNYRPVELWPMLKTLAPSFKDLTFAAYANKFCGAYWDGYGLNTKGASAIEELSGLLQGFMIRRTEQEVYPDRLQPLVEQVPVELTDADLAEVRKAEEEIGSREVCISSSYDKFSQLGDSARLRRLLGMAKVRLVAGYVADLLETVNKVVVFAHHRDVCAFLFQRFSELGFNPVVFAGGMNDRDKDFAKRMFIDEPKCRVFIGQDDAAGTGVDGLQLAASTMVFAEPSWVPGDTEQRLRRLARMGQKDPLVKAYLIYAQGTLDTVMVGVHDRKERVGERLMSTGISTSPVGAAFAEPWELL